MKKKKIKFTPLNSSTHHISNKPKFKTKFTSSSVKQSLTLIQCSHLISEETIFTNNFFHRTATWKIIDTPIARLYKLELLSKYWSTNFEEEQKFSPPDWNLGKHLIWATLCFPTIPHKYVWTAIFLQIANMLPSWSREHTSCHNMKLPVLLLKVAEKKIQLAPRFRQILISFEHF